MSPELKEKQLAEIMRRKILDNFNIEKVKEKNYNIGNPLFLALGRLLVLLTTPPDDKFKIIPYLDRFFSYVDEGKKAKQYYYALLSNNFELFRSEMIVTVSKIKVEYDEYY